MCGIDQGSRVKKARPFQRKFSKPAIGAPPNSSKLQELTQTFDGNVGPTSYIGRIPCLITQRDLASCPGETKLSSNRQRPAHIAPIFFHLHCWQESTPTHHESHDADWLPVVEFRSWPPLTCRGERVPHGSHLSGGIWLESRIDGSARNKQGASALPFQGRLWETSLSYC